jgi:hypothetical protein
VKLAFLLVVFVLKSTRCSHVNVSKPGELAEQKAAGIKVSRL